MQFFKATRTPPCVAAWRYNKIELPAGRQVCCLFGIYLNAITPYTHIPQSLNKSKSNRVQTSALTNAAMYVETKKENRRINAYE